MSPDRPTLVTGGAGFAGSHLIDLLGRDGRSIVATVRPGGAPPGNGSGSHDAFVRWVPVDLLDRERISQLIAQIRPAAIYHCAAAAHVGSSWNHAADTLELNVLGTRNLLEAVRAAKLDPPARLLIPGSAMVYRPGDGPLSENAPIGPTNPYGLSKLAQEMLGRRAVGEEGLPILMTRSFNHAGPRQSPEYSTSSFARQVARIESGLEKPVLRVGNLDAQRDLTDVRDVVLAYRVIVERGQPGRVYNVCSGRTRRVGELLDALLSAARVKVTVQVDPSLLRPHDSPVLLGDPSRIREELGWRPAIPIEQTLYDLLDYWRNRTSSDAQAPGAGRS